jgi:hypothetical protein
MTTTTTNNGYVYLDDGYSHEYLFLERVGVAGSSEPAYRAAKMKQEEEEVRWLVGPSEDWR